MATSTKARSWMPPSRSVTATASTTMRRARAATRGSSSTVRSAGEGPSSSRTVTPTTDSGSATGSTVTAFPCIGRRPPVCGSTRGSSGRVSAPAAARFWRVSGALCAGIGSTAGYSTAWRCGRRKAAASTSPPSARPSGSRRPARSPSSAMPPRASPTAPPPARSMAARPWRRRRRRRPTALLQLGRQRRRASCWGPRQGSGRRRRSASGCEVWASGRSLTGRL
mmetsp:Transcript_171028/g.548071  ORF Transcript_171028/g.548071 Transcript_171028/m.548071 type:complete len:224 (+) Transcript_171028:202-873(+)